jgi:SPW repeat
MPASRTGRLSAANRRRQLLTQRSLHAHHSDEVPCAARLHVGAVLIAGPWIFQYSDDNAAMVISIVLGIGLIAYSLLTNYELGVWKVAPMAVHTSSTSSPARCSRSCRGSSAWPTTARTLAAFVVIGVAAIFLGLTTKQHRRLRLRQDQHTDDGVGLEFLCAAGEGPPRF